MSTTPPDASGSHASDDQSAKTASEASSAAPSDEADIPPLPDQADRWTLLRDVTVFQGKLVLDGLRDLVLSPLSIAAAIVGLLTGGDRPGRQFYDLLYLGRRSEGWINLFGAASHVTPPDFDREDAESVDALVDRLEEVARRRYEKGGMTQNAKDALDKALDAVNKNFGAGGRTPK